MLNGTLVPLLGAPAARKRRKDLEFGNSAWFRNHESGKQWSVYDSLS